MPEKKARSTSGSDASPTETTCATLRAVNPTPEDQPSAPRPFDRLVRLVELWDRMEVRMDGVDDLTPDEEGDLNELVAEFNDVNSALLMAASVLRKRSLKIRNNVLVGPTEGRRTAGEVLLDLRLADSYDEYASALLAEHARRVVSFPK